MNTKELADLLEVVPNTVRRYAAEFHRYLSPSAHPPKGRVRVFSPHDARVMHYIVAARNVGQPAETIAARLEAMQANGWSDLPDVPPEWNQSRETVPIVYAANKAYDMAALAVAQKELEHTRAELEMAQNALVESRQKIADLETEMNALRDSQTAAQTELQTQLHMAQLEAEKYRGEVETLRARLDAYALAYGIGRDRPLPIVLIVALTAVAVAVLVIVLLVVVRLVL